MKFIKNNIFVIAQFLNVWLAVSNIFDLVKQQNTFTSAMFNIVVSTISVIVIIMAEVWYKNHWRPYLPNTPNIWQIEIRRQNITYIL